MPLTPSELQELSNPSFYSSASAEELARKYAARVNTFYSDLTGYLQVICNSSHPEFLVIERILQILQRVAPGRCFCAALRVVFATGPSKIRHRTMECLVKKDPELQTCSSLLDDPDHRVRANIVEALWPLQYSGAEGLYLRAAGDSHHRVAANAIYGLYALAPELALPLIRSIAAHKIPSFRAAAAWIIRKTGDPSLGVLLKPLLADPNPNVRKGAIKSQLELRLKAA